MKKVALILSVVCVVCLPATAQEFHTTYVGEIQTVDLGIPLAIAADNNGGIYYTVINYSVENSSGCYYIENPLDIPPADDHLIVEDGLDSTIPPGRAVTGVVLDSQGNVYLTVETGSPASSSINKRGPAPDFEWDFDFGDGGWVLPNLRVNSVELLTDEIIAVSTFETVSFYDTNTGELLHEVTGGETYQRDMAYNPSTHDIYIAKNRDVSGYPISSANLLSEGSPDNLEGYTTISPDFIPQGGSGGQYGTKQQKIEYDPVNDLIIIPGLTPMESGAEFQPYIGFYSPSDTSTLVTSADASESPNGPLDQTSDAVSVQIDGETYIFVTDYNESSDTNRIVIFTLDEGTPVLDWMVH